MRVIKGVAGMLETGDRPRNRTAIPARINPTRKINPTMIVTGFKKCLRLILPDEGRICLLKMLCGAPDIFHHYSAYDCKAKTQPG